MEGRLGCGVGVFQMLGSGFKFWLKKLFMLLVNILVVVVVENVVDGPYFGLVCCTTSRGNTFLLLWL